MKAIVDRIEDGIIVLEIDGGILNFKASALPNAHEGDVIDLTLSEDGALSSYNIDHEETALRAQCAKRRLSALFSKTRK